MSGQQPSSSHIPENSTERRGATAPDVAAKVAEVTQAALAAVAAARYTSIAWAQGNELTEQAAAHPAVATLDVLQAILGQGPSLDALRARHTVTIPDTGCEQRWPVFAAHASQVGVGTMVSLPLSVRQENLGVLNLYATRPDAFTSDDEATATVFANDAATTLSGAAEPDSVQAVTGRAAMGPHGPALTQRHPSPRRRCSAGWSASPTVLT
jgi:hypothetical protein